MEHLAVLKLINEAEANFPVEEWKIGSYRIWPIVRINLAFLLYEESNPKSAEANLCVETTAPKKPFQKIRNFINWENRTVKHRLDDYIIKKKINRKGAVAFFSLVVNRTLLSNVWHNRSVDPIADELRKKRVPHVLFEFKGYTTYKYPRYNNDICINLDEILKRGLKIKPLKKEDFSLQQYDVFLEQLQQKCPQINFKSISQESITGTMAYVDALVNYFYNMLNGSAVKICFTTCYYEIKMMALIAACKKAGITTVELPHGTHGDTHAAFGKWQKVPAEGYAMLPDIFWCWSKYEKDAIDAWALPQNCPHKAIIGGNPWLAAWKDEHNPLVKKFDQKVEAIKKKNGLHILFTVQPFNEFERAMPSYLIDAIRNSPPDWKWLIRLHPRQPHSIEHFQKMLEKEISASDFNIREATELPLPALLRHTDVHFTIYSSSVIEAAEFGVASVVMKNGNDIFKTLVAPEKLFCAENTADSVIEGIKVQRSNKSSMHANKIDSFKILSDLLISATSESNQFKE